MEIVDGAAARDPAIARAGRRRRTSAPNRRREERHETCGRRLRSAAGPLRARHGPDRHPLADRGRPGGHDVPPPRADDPDEAEAASPPPISRSELAALARIGAVFALSLALYDWVSPLAAGATLVAGSLLALGERRPLVIVLMPSALLLALWLLFYKVLGTAIV